MLKSDAAAFLAGVKQVEGAPASAPTNLHVITGEVGATSEDGKTTISLDGLVFSEEDSQEIEMDTLGGLEEGDVATVLLTGENGRGMTPLAIGAPGSIDRIKSIASSAAEIADAAQEVAEATNQHFFADDNGIHVTEATQEDWDENHTGANMLINSIGQLFRDGLNNLLTLTTQAGARAFTIWDGLGNEADNILGQFSADRIRIGKHIADNADYDGAYIDFFDGDWFHDRVYSNIFVSDDQDDPAKELSLGMEGVIEGTFPGTKAFIDASFGASARVYGDELGAHEEITRASLASGTSGRYASTSMGVVTKETYEVVDGYQERTDGLRQAYIHADELELTYDVGQLATTRTHDIKHVSTVLRSPVGTYTGTNGSATASASGWQLTWFNTVVAEVGSPRSYDYSFSNGILTAQRDCVLEISGVMNWYDAIAGLRGFGIFEGTRVNSGTEHSAFQSFAANLAGNRKSAVFPPKLFTLTAGSSLTFGRYQQQNAVYINGTNYSWVTIKVVG